MWTSKVGTRGNVYEGYVIQELKLKPISSYLSKVFFRVGYQYYDFDYTGSNNWIGAPVKISDLALSPVECPDADPPEDGPGPLCHLRGAFLTSFTVMQGCEGHTPLAS